MKFNDDAGDPHLANDITVFIVKIYLSHGKEALGKEAWNAAYVHPHMVLQDLTRLFRLC